MPDVHTRFDGSVPAYYDRYLGPLLFEDSARDLVARLDLGPRTRVLEIAAGTGIVTRHLRARLPRSAKLVASDLNQPMLDFARSGFSQDASVEWRQADATALPFEPATFDVVVCQYGLMFFPDKPAAAREARRVLAPGGTFAFSVWGPLATNPHARLAHETIASLFPVNPPDFYALPFGYHDRAAITTLLAATGFTRITCEPRRFEGTSPSAVDAATGLVFGNPVLAAIKERGTISPEAVVDALAARFAREFGDHPLRLPLQALVWTARAG